MDTFLQFPPDHSSWILVPNEIVVPWTKITQNNLALQMHIYLLFSFTLYYCCILNLCDTAWGLIFELMFDFWLEGYKFTSLTAVLFEIKLPHAHQFLALIIICNYELGV